MTLASLPYHGRVLTSVRAFIFVLAALCIAVPLVLFFHPSALGGSQGWLFDIVSRPKTFNVEPPRPPSKYFDWPTKSVYHPVRYDNASNTPIAELCDAFPTHLLNDIQPVLKTGHGVLRERLGGHFRTATACLSNLLIFSDLDEEFEGHQIIDIIADIPPYLPHSKNKTEPHPGHKTPVDQLAPYTALQEFAANHTLDVADTSHLDGWKTDKFKFLPGISRAWKTNPERSWYIFFEDDSYIVWDNLLRLLPHLDPDLPWYLGAPAPNRKPAPDLPKTWFAYGGPGYILSRGAMRILVRDDWDAKTGEYLGSKLTERWWTEEVLHNCCGDAILGWALWNMDVPMTTIAPMITGHKPDRIPFSDRFWCSPVLSMHRISEERAVDLWRWEWEKRTVDRPLLFRDIALSYFDFSQLTTLDDWDNTGQGSYAAPLHSDRYSHDPHASFDACKAACEALPLCMQYTYHLQTCKIDKSFRFGEQRSPELGKIGKEVTKEESKVDWDESALRFRSGWMKERILEWMAERPCDEVKWLRPHVAGLP